jgi:hypothetical protein
MASRIQSDVRVFSLDSGRRVPGSRLGPLCDPLRGPVPGRHGRRTPDARERPFSIYQDGHQECCGIRKVVGRRPPTRSAGSTRPTWSSAGAEAVAHQMATSVTEFKAKYALASKRARPCSNTAEHVAVVVALEDRLAPVPARGRVVKQRGLIPSARAVFDRLLQLPAVRGPDRRRSARCRRGMSGDGSPGLSVTGLHLIMQPSIVLS